LWAVGRVHALDRAALDLTDSDAIRRTVRWLRPDLIVNAAAYTAVDRAEAEPDLAMAVNGRAPGLLAREAARAGAAMVHFSTDYVFDGRKDVPYREDDPTAPLNCYGRSKLAGEARVLGGEAPGLVFRVSWVYDGYRNNFVTTMLRLFEEQAELKVVDDQYGSPTWSRAIAGAVTDVLVHLGQGEGGIDHGLRSARGLYHLSASGSVTWCAFARAILRKARSLPGRQVKARRISAIPSTSYPQPAGRPTNSVLSNGRFRNTFGFSLPSWEQQLEECLSQLCAPSRRTAPPRACTLPHPRKGHIQPERCGLSANRTGSSGY
jgi:dTDP-4-dehydrorhamnose reductase